MKKAKISIICAVADGNRGIGLNNKLLFWIPEDLKRFKEITTGHVVVMGQNTFKSIGKPLPKRTNIVVTKDMNFKSNGVIVAYSMEEALEKAMDNEKDEIFFIGGGSIYLQAMEFADKLYLTLVEGSPEADSFFPDYKDFKKVIFEQSREYEGLKYRFVELEK
jgi:dihydrofolate reductase